jgi:hypothetical protein
MIGGVTQKSGPLLTIGEFGRQTRLTAKALRSRPGPPRPPHRHTAGQAILGGGDDVGVTDLIGIRTEPAHDEAFTTITKAQWAYPAILAAYDAVACSPAASARPGSRLSCREVYVAEPEAAGDDELICDVAFPIG